MKKKLWLLTFLVLLTTVFLCACGDKNKPSKGPGTTDNVVKWETVPMPSMTEVYAKFLGGATTHISNLSRASLKSSPKMAAEGKLKVAINGNDFWLTLKLNYNNNDKSAAMLAIELSTKEDSYEDNLLACYLYQERLYLAIGESKFSVNCPPEFWDKYFPLDYIEKDMNKTAVGMASVLVNVQGKEPIAKQRKSGSNTETKYTIFIDLPATASKLVEFATGADGLINIDLDRVDAIVKTLLGVSFEDIKSGKFPKSELTFDFTLYDMKLSEVNFDLEIKDLDDDVNLFDGDELKLKINLKSFYTYKTQNVSIPFVNNDYAAERAKYVYYRDNAFRLTLDALKEIDEGEKKQYLVNLTAKVFQENTADNYAFVEYTDKETDKIVKALYIYEDTAYFYDTVDEELKCLLSMPFDLTDASNRTVANDFNGESKLSIMGAVSHFIKSVKISATDMKFSYNQDFYKYLWYNMGDMLNFTNEKFEENILEIPEIKSFMDFATTKPSVVTFRYDTAFLSVVPDNDTGLKETIAMIKKAEPAKTLVEKSVDEDKGEDNGENKENTAE